AGLAAPHVGVRGGIRAERGGGVVDVERTQPVEPERVVDLRHQRVDHGRLAEVHAGNVDGARIKAEPESRVAGGVDHGGQLGDVPTDRVAGAGGVLEQQPAV